MDIDIDSDLMAILLEATEIPYLSVASKFSIKMRLFMLCHGNGNRKPKPIKIMYDVVYLCAQENRRQDTTHLIPLCKPCTINIVWFDGIVQKNRFLFLCTEHNIAAITLRRATSIEHITIPNKLKFKFNSVQSHKLIFSIVLSFRIHNFPSISILRHGRATVCPSLRLRLHFLWLLSMYVQALEPTLKRNSIMRIFI